MDLVAFINKWLHLLSIVTVLGGAIVMALSVLPVIKTDEADSDTARRIWRSFAILMGVAWLIVLATGFFNLVLVSPHVKKGYHMIVVMKIALALLMFCLAILIRYPILA